MSLEGMLYGKCNIPQKGMESMKRRIFKRLAAVLLTAAVMITNIGITSAAAEELPTFSENIGASVVGAAEAFAAGDVFTYSTTQNSNYGVTLWLGYSKGRISYDAEFSTKFILNYGGSGTRELTADELKLFYFSDSASGSGKVKGLYVKSAETSGSTITLTIAFNYDEFNSQYDHLPYTNRALEDMCIKQELYLCYPHATSSGTETKVIKNPSPGVNGSDISATLYAYFCPQKFDLSASSNVHRVKYTYIDQYGAMSEKISEDTYISTYIAPTAYPFYCESELELISETNGTKEYRTVYNTSMYEIVDINGDKVTSDFELIPSYYTSHGKNKAELSLKLKNQDLKTKKITAASNKQYRVMWGSWCVGAFYVVNNIEASEITPTAITDPSSSSSQPTGNDTVVYGDAFPKDFDPIFHVGVKKVSNDGHLNFLTPNYAARLKLENTKIRCTELLVENGTSGNGSSSYFTANDTATENVLKNLTNPANYGLFYISTATDPSEALAKKLDMIRPSGYDANNYFKMTFDVGALNSQTCKNVEYNKWVNVKDKDGSTVSVRDGLCYLWYPAYDENGNIVQKRCDEKLIIGVDCPPIKWDINKKGKITVSGFTGNGVSRYMSADSPLYVYKIDDDEHEVDDFNVVHSSADGKSVDVTIKPTSKLNNGEYAAGDNQIYVIKYGYTGEIETRSIMGAFYIVSDGSGIATVSETSSDDTPSATISADGSIKVTAGQTLDLSYNNDTGKIMMDGIPVASTKKILYEVNEDGSHKNVSKFTDSSQYRWVIEELPQNAKGFEVAAKSAKIKSGDKYNKSEITDTDTISIGATKANGNFNSAVIVKLAAKDYKAKKSSKIKDGNSAAATFGSILLYIAPSVPTKWKDVSSKLSKAGLTAAGNEKGYEKVYNMSIADGKSATLPFALSDGKDRSMVYELCKGANGFSVVKGKVKALAGGGSGDIICYPTVSPDKKILVHVTTTSAVKSLRANTTKLTLFAGTSQTIYLGTVPPSYGTDFNIGGQKSGTFTGGTWSISGNALTITGGNDVAKGTKSTLDVSAADKTIKITISGAAAPQNAKSFKLATKKLNADGFIEVNIPIGTVYNLGIAMNPVTADAGFTWKYAKTPQPEANAKLDGEKTVIEYTANGNDKVYDIDVCGDIIKGNKKCIYYMQAVSEALDAGGNALRTPIYKINVYEPGSTIVMNTLEDDENHDAETFSIVGGILMSKAQADSLCSKNLTGGKSYTFPAPTTAGAVQEEIIWSCNKPAAVDIDTSTDGYMTLTPLWAGSFTVTGTTKYTKQKMSFKVNSAAKDNAIENADVSNYKLQYQKADESWDDIDSSVSLAAKQKMNIRVYSSLEGAVGTVKFVTSTSANCAVNASGVLTAKAAGTAKVGAVITLKKSDKNTKTINLSEVEFSVTAPAAEFKSISVPIGIIKGEQGKFAAAVKNVRPADIKSIKWEYASSADAEDKDWTAISGAGTLSGKFNVDIAAGIYYVRCNADGVTSDPQKMAVYAQGQNIKSVTVNYTFAEYSDELAEAAGVDKASGEGAALTKSQKNALKKINKAYKNAINVLKGTKSGEGAGYGIYYIPVFASPVTSGTKLTLAGDDDIIWTSTNVNLASAKTVTAFTNGGYQSSLLRKAASPYAIVKIDTTAGKTNKYTGKVTLTGILRNSGKKITITLNVSGIAGTEDNSGSDTQEPEPQTDPSTDPSENSEPEGNGSEGNESESTEP